MRALILAAGIGWSAGAVVAPPATHGEEALFLRIRPNGAGLDAVGASDAASDEEIIARAWARREAVWIRSDARARIAIASVCTGCMKPTPLAPVAPSPRSDATDSASRSDGIALPDAASFGADPSAPLPATAGEP